VGVRARAERVRAIVLDVDGVLTDAGLYYGRGGEALKRFSARDGFAIVSAQKEGLAVAVLSGRLAPPLRGRLRDLHIPAALVIEGSRDKASDVTALAGRIGVSLDALAFVGDDLPDLPALALVGLAACPSDAAPEVKERCHLVCAAAGGDGAVREVVETVLRAQGRWQTIVDAWAAPAPPPRQSSEVRGRGSAPPSSRKKK
jgi:3-deoxy-D-manno-octulosonate 8-phosphate phosphatase (KDO 8-P phosphatase)